MSKLGDNLRNIREARGLKQTYVAERLGIANNTLSAYERGSRDPDSQTLKRLAEFYGVSTDFLLGIPSIEDRKLVLLNMLKDKKIAGTPINPAQLDMIVTMFAYLPELNKDEQIKTLTFLKQNIQKIAKLNENELEHLTLYLNFLVSNKN